MPEKLHEDAKVQAWPFKPGQPGAGSWRCSLRPKISAFTKTSESRGRHWGAGKSGWPLTAVQAPIIIRRIETAQPLQDRAMEPECIILDRATMCVLDPEGRMFCPCPGTKQNADDHFNHMIWKRYCWLAKCLLADQKIMWWPRGRHKEVFMCERARQRANLIPFTGRYGELKRRYGLWCDMIRKNCRVERLYR